MEFIYSQKVQEMRCQRGQKEVKRALLVGIIFLFLLTACTRSNSIGPQQVTETTANFNNMKVVASFENTSMTDDQAIKRTFEILQNAEYIKNRLKDYEQRGVFK